MSPWRHRLPDLRALRQELLEEVHLQIIGRDDQNILKCHRRCLSTANDFVRLKLGDKLGDSFRLGAARLRAAVMRDNLARPGLLPSFVPRTLAAWRASRVRWAFRQRPFYEYTPWRVLINRDCSGNRWPQTTCANCAGCSGDLLPSSPPREKAAARQDQAGQGLPSIRLLLA
jgi:hypothetical protein